LASSGIPTFRHPFFNSATELTAEPIPEYEVERLLAEPIAVGTTPSSVFNIESLLPSGAKNPDFDASSQPPVDRKGQDPYRGILFDYFLRGDDFVPLVEKVDLGFAWGKDANSLKLKTWPFTILLQGDKDEDVDKDVGVSVRENLGARSMLLMAEGQGHRFGRTNFLEDDFPGVEEIKLALRTLTIAVTGGLDEGSVGNDS